MRLTAAVIACLISVAASSIALAQDPACRLIAASGAGFVQECGKQLHSFDLSLSESRLGLPGIKRDAGLDIHGRFSFLCPVEPMCANEPDIGGYFLAPSGWLSSARDEQAIFQVLLNMPCPGGHQPPVPSASCPVFDVSVDGLNGRAVCFSEGKGSTVLIVAADDRVGILLYFSQRDKRADDLKGRVLEMLSLFQIERATGDTGLKRWLR